MKIHEPLTHWGNFSVPELKQILEHCIALDTLGIAQDEVMVRDIEREIALRGKKKEGYEFPAKIVKKPSHRTKQESSSLLEQNA